jgi:hypothetical protein
VDEEGNGHGGARGGGVVVVNVDGVGGGHVDVGGHCGG